MIFDWKIQLEQAQHTPDLKAHKFLYQGIHLPCKNDQGYCDHTTHPQPTINWLPEDTSTTFQVANIQARMIKILQKNYRITESQNQYHLIKYAYEKKNLMKVPIKTGQALKKH